MKQVYVLNPKGGCGKTTITTQLAGFYAKQGLSVLVVDHDVQRCAADWLTARSKSLYNEHLAAMPCLDLSALDITSLECDLILHDLPAAWSITLAKGSIKPCDKVIIPVLPSPQDIRAFYRFFMQLLRAGAMEEGWDIGLIANRVKAGIAYKEVLHEFLKRLPIPLVGSIRDSQNYVKAMDQGLSIFDFAPSRVKKDVKEWTAITEWLAISIEGKTEGKSTGRPEEQY